MCLRIEERMARENHPFTLFSCPLAFPFVLCRFEAYVHEELHDILRRIGEKHRNPMELVRMICGIHKRLTRKYYTNFLKTVVFYILDRYSIRRGSCWSPTLFYIFIKRVTFENFFGLYKVHFIFS